MASKSRAFDPCVFCMASGLAGLGVFPVKRGRGARASGDCRHRLQATLFAPDDKRNHGLSPVVRGHIIAFVQNASLMPLIASHRTRVLSLIGPL